LIKDYQIDATGTAHVFALMAFAGVRPEETKRLQWDAIHLDEDCIIISGDVAKTRSHRIIPIESNLSDWLKTVPEKERTGSVTPSNWAKKYQIVRKISGIGKRQQDILRHTFASAHLAAYSDFNTLQAAMGHGTTEMILKHYKALMKKPEAVKFWSIRPHETQVQLKAVG
jgi:integrase